MLASLPMYDLPEARAATDDLWRGIASALRRAGIDDVPGALTRDPDIDVWHSRELLLSQTCGYPLTHALAGVVELVATPAYSAECCSGADYRSLVVVSEDNPAVGLDDLRGGVCAYNARHSQSGYNVLRAAIAPLADGAGFFSNVIESGDHGNSIALVATGRADVCATDCVTHAMIARYRPDALDGTRVLCATECAPGLPYVTRAGIDRSDVERLRDGLRTAFAEPDLAVARDALFLSGIEILSLDAYRRIDDMENSARDSGYAEIH
jgi:ABC-type phosphate/phosphonate transport system substrate-binding protein